MSIAENKAAVRRFLEGGLNARNFALIEELVDPAFIWHGGSFGETRNLASFRQVVGPFIAAFPDLSIMSRT